MLAETSGKRMTKSMATNGGTDDEGIVSVVTDEENSFLDKQKKRLREIEKKLEEEAFKRKREWEKEVERMRREFLTLYPVDKTWDTGEGSDDPLVARRRGSVDILDTKKMKTLFSDSPYHGYKFRLRFDVKNYEIDTLKVNLEGDAICVRAVRKEEQEDGEVIQKEYYRKIEKPVEVDSDKLHCCLTKDKVLIVESSLPPNTLNFKRSNKPGSPSHFCSSAPSSSHSQSPSNSPHTPSSGISVALNKPGVPIFGGLPNERRMNLVVDIGKYFKPKEITCQVLASNRIMIRAKHEERTTERFSKSKYNREWELGEKIEAYSIRAGLTEDGKLIVGALGKDHDMVKKGRHGQELWDELSSDATPCNVLDLASFPPKTPT